MIFSVDSAECFDAVCKAFSDPSFYPHAVNTIERRDTHISVVFLTGDWVYKLKKPVDFGFLNFLQLSDRRHFCEQEVQLNRRFSHDIYESVVPVYQMPDGQFTLQKTEKVAEYAVQMRQLPDESALVAILANDRMPEARLMELGSMLVEFYRRTERNQTIDHYGSLEVVSFNVEENFSQMASFLELLPDVEKWHKMCHETRTFMEQHAPLFEKRIADGFIRDGHGDLRAEHVYFYNGVQIIDCIEFNERFRYGDTAVDLAFLYMDLECLGYADAARTLMAAYAAEADDPELYALLDFYAAYRAVVRLKVSCFQLADAGKMRREGLMQDIATYFRLAYQYTLRFSRPTVWVFCGLPATGKSMLAERLSQVLSIPLVQSDTLRKEDQEQSVSQVLPFGQGMYCTEARSRVYKEMRERAAASLGKGRSVILDATYARREWRLEISRLAKAVGASCLFVECMCNTEVMRSRLKAREQSTVASDARLEHLPDMIESFEPLTEQTFECRMQMNTDQPFQDVFFQFLMEGYYHRDVQIQQDLSLPI
jgi:hypothetical protein